MNKEEKFLESRILELAQRCYQKNIYTYSDFLNLNEQNILNSFINKLPPVNFELTGGNVYAERKIVAFIPEFAGYEENLPIEIIKIAPLNFKFSDKLSHRDYLGAILNLGIDRAKIGDIIVKNDVAYVYAIEGIVSFITENLTRIKHTSVMCEVYPLSDIDTTPEMAEVRGTVQSVRLDSVISLAFGTSRSSIVGNIEEGRVFVNGKLITSNGYQVKEGDIVSVRGIGRCRYDENLGVTKKGRNLIKISKYV
ncbi:MAG: RNA-binding protein [Lachnospiraceae bacterium]|nr:RNA-binding protein [Lachnospiraceae bacterium]